MEELSYLNVLNAVMNVIRRVI
ncbi:UNVERIFIED_CONTAM: hypothetical protein GTU68_051651 [Idotea baltica]|nr:hypothetical protein [Idotea baltica]